MYYLDFELAIDSENGNDYSVTVLNSPGGGWNETIRAPLALDNQLLAEQNALFSSGGIFANEQMMQKFGQDLFNALFVGAVRDCYMMSWGTISDQGKGLRLKLRIHSPMLATLPWEFLYDPIHEQYLSLSIDTPIVRYLEVPQPRRPRPISLPLKILGMTANPKDLANLEVDSEKGLIEEALKDLMANNLVNLTWVQGHTWKCLEDQLLNDDSWHIFHFIGHGGFDPHNNEGVIALENDAGQADIRDATEFAGLLTDHHSLQLIVLNTCEGARNGTSDIFSSTATTLVRRGIPAVLANQYQITDTAALELSSIFYTALARGYSIDVAVTQARKAINGRVRDTLEWGIPVLSTHTPDGVLFDIAQVPSQHTNTPVAPSDVAPTKPSLPQLPQFVKEIIAAIMGLIGLIVLGFGGVGINVSFADPNNLITDLITDIVLIIIGGLIIYLAIRMWQGYLPLPQLVKGTIVAIVGLIGLIVLGFGGVVIDGNLTSGPSNLITGLITGIVLIIIGGLIIYLAIRIWRGYLPHT